MLFFAFAVPIVQGAMVVMQLTAQDCRQSPTVFGHSYTCRPDNTIIVGVDFMQTPGSYPITRADGDRIGTITVQRRILPALRQFPPLTAWLSPAARAARMKRRAREVRRYIELIQSAPSVYPELTTEVPFRNPLENIAITSPFGQPRRFGTALQWHRGVDLRAPYHTPVVAVGAGTVLMADQMLFEGSIVVIYHGSDTYSLYMHLSDIIVSPGHLVRSGDTIGRSGDSGARGQPHLHFAIKVNNAVVDPLLPIMTVRPR